MNTKKILASALVLSACLCFSSPTFADYGEVKPSEEVSRLEEHAEYIEAVFEMDAIASSLLDITAEEDEAQGAAATRFITNVRGPNYDDVMNVPARYSYSGTQSDGAYCEGILTIYYLGTEKKGSQWVSYGLYEGNVTIKGWAW